MHRFVSTMSESKAWWAAHLLKVSAVRNLYTLQTASIFCHTLSLVCLVNLSLSPSASYIRLFSLRLFRSAFRRRAERASRGVERLNSSLKCELEGRGACESSPRPGISNHAFILWHSLARVCLVNTCTEYSTAAQRWTRAATFTRQSQKVYERLRNCLLLCLFDENTHVYNKCFYLTNSIYSLLLSWRSLMQIYFHIYYQSKIYRIYSVYIYIYITFSKEKMGLSSHTNLTTIL